MDSDPFKFLPDDDMLEANSNIPWDTDFPLKEEMENIEADEAIQHITSDTQEDFSFLSLEELCKEMDDAGEFVPGEEVRTDETECDINLYKLSSDKPLCIEALKCLLKGYWSGRKQVLPHSSLALTEEENRISAVVQNLVENTPATYLFNECSAHEKGVVHSLLRLADEWRSEEIKADMDTKHGAWVDSARSSYGSLNSSVRSAFENELEYREEIVRYYEELKNTPVASMGYAEFLKIVSTPPVAPLSLSKQFGMSILSIFWPKNAI